MTLNLLVAFNDWHGEVAHNLLEKVFSSSCCGTGTHHYGNALA